MFSSLLSKTEKDKESGNQQKPPISGLFGKSI
jgi:hypothetical protein